MWLERIWVCLRSRRRRKTPKFARLTSPPDSPLTPLADFCNLNSISEFGLKCDCIWRFVFFRPPSCTSAFCCKNAPRQCDADVPLYRCVAALPRGSDGRLFHFLQDSFQIMFYALLFLPTAHLSIRFRCPSVFL